MAKQADLQALWQAIMQAGGIPAYIQNELKSRGFLVQHKEPKDLKEKELEAYKKARKQESLERRKLARLAWQAYRAQNIVHLGEGVFWSDDKKPDRYDLAKGPERLAELGVPQIEGPKELAELLGLTLSELRWLTYHRDAAVRIHYRRFTLAKRDGSPRPIWAPLPKLKAAQHWILRNIAERLVVHGAVHGFLAGRGTLSNARSHIGARVVLKMDVKNFFPTVTWRRVKGVFRKAGYGERVATLLALLCTEAPREVVVHQGTTYYVSLGPRCLPQGAPTSPALTSTLCLRLDQRLTGLASKLGWRYTRYADDLTFSLPADFAGEPRLAKLIGFVKKIAAGEGFRIHPEKTRIARSGGAQRVTGLIVNGPESPRVPRDVRRQLRAAIHNLQQGKPLRAGESIERLRGLAAYVCLTHPDLGRKMMQALQTLADTAPHSP